MATPQLSPGILVREVDLTVGRADNVLDNIGAIAGPFRLGPIDTPIQVSNEEDLIKNFGKPLSTDRQYEYWMSAASFLSYGGVLKVVRADDDDLGNANAGVGIASTTVIGATGGLKIESFDDYQENHTSDTSFYYAGKHPGSWANGLKICQIDDQADQIIGINTTSFRRLRLHNWCWCYCSTHKSRDTGSWNNINVHGTPERNCYRSINRCYKRRF